MNDKKNDFDVKIMMTSDAYTPVAPKISILIPVYNVAAYVQDCLNSVLMQIDHEAEIIVYDDASTDSSQEILVKLQRDKPQVKVIYATENRGVSFARNMLKQQARGQYLWFIDSDDIVAEHAYTVIREAIDDHPDVDVIIGDYYFWDESKTPSLSLEKTFSGRTRRVMQNRDNQFLKVLNHLKKNYIWCQVYRRDLLTDIDFQLRERFEDIFFITDVSQHCQSYIYLAKPLIHYRYRPYSSTTSRKNIRYVDDYLSAFLHRSHQVLASSLMTCKANAYLHYKLYMQYASFIKEIMHDAHLSAEEKGVLVLYIAQHFQDEYAHIAQQLCGPLDVIRQFRLNRKQKQVQHYYQVWGVVEPAALK